MGSYVQRSGAPQRTVNINTTTTTTATQQGNQQWQQRPNNNGQGQQQRPHDKCAECKLSNHKTKNCRRLMNMGPDKVREKANEMKLCHNCGEPGHHSRGCKEPKPVCEICGNQHLTIFHAAIQIRNRENLEREKQKVTQPQTRPSTQGNPNQHSNPNQLNNNQSKSQQVANAAATRVNNPQQATPVSDEVPPTNGATEL